MLKNPLRVFDDVTQAIGQTPMVKIDRIMKAYGIKCEVYAKCEAMNPGQSVKDRICLTMIDLAEKEGRLKPGDTIVECTSGNTGIGLAIIAAIRGYKIKVTTPDKVSIEKLTILKALGAEVIICDTKLPASNPSSYKGMAKILSSKPGHYWVNQYENEANPLTHYNTTGIEICEQMADNIDYCFIGAGTGGTLTGVGERIKERIANCKIIGIDPIGSNLAQPETLNVATKSYKTEGLGQTCVPGIIKRELVHEWVKVGDAKSFIYARELIKYEGLLMGGSSGTILAGMIEYIKNKNLQDNEALRCMLIFPDSAKNYMSKFMSDEWMVGNGFWSYDSFIDEGSYFGLKTLKDFVQFKPVPYYDKRLTVSDCIDLFKKGHGVIPIRDNGNILGVVEKRTFIKQVVSEGLNDVNSASHCLEKDFLMIDYLAPFSVVQKILQNRHHVLLAKSLTDNSIGDIYVVTHDDLIKIMEADYKEYI